MPENVQPTIELELDGDIYTDIVPQSYRLDPEVDDLIYGEEIQEGMVILTERSRRKSEYRPSTNPEGILIENRWCTVTKMRPYPEGGSCFVGVYADGSREIRTTGRLWGWLVKKDSMPADKPEYPTLDDDANEKHFRAIGAVVDEDTAWFGYPQQTPQGYSTSDGAPYPDGKINL